MLNIYFINAPCSIYNTIFKKQNLLSLILILASSCSSTIYSYIDKESRKSVSLNDEKINLRNLKINLSEKRGFTSISADNIKSKFLTAEAMREMFKSEIESRAESDIAYSKDNAMYQFDIFLDLSRNFSAFSSDVYVALEVKEADIKVFKNNVLFAQHHLEGPIDCGNNRGLIGNWTFIAKTLTLQGNEKDEIEDVKRCAVAIYNTFKRLGS